ncbi:hypothetical protein [Halorussus halophilus]|uniref:hypothetical protein n=1 Tax=Halorussus halophilus TaxID=2650975 RepID=UPI00130115FE|nr:hypothetical protein [Halorussus halophilus]
MSPPSRRKFLRRFGAGVAVPATGTHVRYRSKKRTKPTTVEWKRTYGTSDFQCDKLVGNENHVLLVGRTGSGRSETPWLTEVDAEGERMWTTTIKTPGFTTAVDAVPVNGGYTVLGTTDESPSLWLLHLDNNGQEQWRHRTEAPHGVHVLHDIEDGYLIGGYRGNPRRVDADLDAWLRAVDTDGRTRWDRTYDGTFVSDVLPHEEGFLLAGGTDGDAWLRAIRPDGTSSWNHTYGGVESEGVSVALPTDDGFLYAGRTQSIPNDYTRGMLVKTTTNGEFVWRRTYDLRYVVDVTPLDEGFAFTGEPNNQDRTGRDPEKPISLVDRWGRVQELVTVSVDLGEPVGLSQFNDGTLVVGGWSGEDGIWLAKVEFET